MELERKGTAKVRALLDIEQQMQSTWEKEKLFEVNAPPAGAGGVDNKGDLDLLFLLAFAKGDYAMGVMCAFVRDA